MGSIFKVPVLEWKDEFEAKTALLKHYALDLDGVTYHEVAWSAGLIWVGSESHGLQVAEALPHQKITIPRLGRAESLNAGVAGSIACAEIARSFGKT